MKFPENFVWGAAAASYQIEGAAYEDGKGLSVWDIFTRQKGAIENGDNGDIACNHYHRYKEDVQLMKELGLQAYRLSLSWPRILANGTGKVNQKGLDFYDKLIDELLENGIEPYITLFHWDYPYELYKKGGWLNPDSPDWFAEYTEVVVQKLSDRVKNWITINEPQVFVNLGHKDGVHAPGLKLGMEDLLQISHNVLLAHGKGARVIRETSVQDCRIGLAPSDSPVFPATKSEENIQAARRASFSVEDKGLWAINWWMDPVILGRYPEEGLKIFEEYLPEIKTDDFKIISEPIDFFGVNIYQGVCVKLDDKGQAVPAERKVGYARNAYYWPITPEALYWGPRFYYERYKKPVIITENGMSNVDWVAVDGKVHDPQRIDFTNRYLRELQKAGEDGVDIQGYFHWSLMDNFEWAQGYLERFGLIYVDFETGERIIKDSAYWYKKVIETKGEALYA
ncbi:MAG TPA: beta-glucosidase [Halanaerobiaceae bacterium]|nr:beta-glucosidase [Halanaerobiaceae bacterium]HOA41607.1 GH1 family beta-glucosidase [Halanaerobiales bacterium]HPZ63209.1 GH1 family beta-glucosidase [Halanaerobiales bacterium]HQD04435.1 GH1 family beta-glucosidase [Halanaerobiales bacterium]